MGKAGVMDAGIEYDRKGRLNPQLLRISEGLADRKLVLPNQTGSKRIKSYMKRSGSPIKRILMNCKGEMSI